MISSISQQYTDYIASNLNQSVVDVIEIIERGFATNNNLRSIWYRDFRLKLLQINGNQISVLSQSGALEQRLWIFVVDDGGLLLDSKIECSKQFCLEIHDDTNTLGQVPTLKRPRTSILAFDDLRSTMQSLF